MVTSIPLSAVEDLLNEFNYPNTTNARKHEIEKQLIDFQNNLYSWPQCLYQLSSNSMSSSSSTTNQFFWFFNVSTVETAIVRKWKFLDKADRVRLRDTLWSNYVTMSGPNVPRIQREKIAQLIALMGKREFPDEHSSYMCHVMELLKTNFILGITLLRTTSEELVSTRDDLTSDQKKYFHSNLSMCMPEVFQLLTQFLIIYTYGVNGIDLALVPSSLADRKLIQSLPKDNRLSLSAIELLNCIQHLLSWTCSDDLLQEQFLINLLDLSSWKEHNSDISVAAMTALMELFYRQRALPFPHIIGNGIKNILIQPRLDLANEMYQDKLTELLKLFIAQQWTKWVDDDVIFPEIVSALYAYTFTSYGALAFTEKLAIWQPIINGLAMNGFGRYTQTMHLLVTGILQKMQFRFDPELKVLDNESLDDDMLTEWQQYLTQCIETIALVAEVRPLQVFEQVYSEWRRPFEIFESLEKSIDPNGSLIILDNQRCHLVHSVLRDLSSLCQTLTRLTSILQDRLQEIPKNLSQITYCLIYAIKFIAINKLHSISLANSSLSNNFVDIFAQLLNSIRNLLTWSPILQSENELKSLIENVAQILMPPANILQEPKIITLAAAQLILSVSSTIRPRYMLDCLSIKQLIQIGSNLTYLDQQAAAYIRNSLVNCFVLPWPQVQNVEQAYERRSFLLQEYIQSLAENLLNLDHSATAHSQHDKLVKVITVVLPILKDIINYHRDSSSSVKQMLAAAFKPTITKSLQLFKQFGSMSEDIVGCVLNFALSVIQTLQIQLGLPYVRDMLDVFLEATTREQLTTNRYKTVEKLMQMLLLVVQQPGIIGMSLLPLILDFSLNYVSPLLRQVKNPSDCCDVAFSLYSLFDGILHNRWQYFYKSQVLRGFSPGASDESLPAEEDQPEHSDQLLAILNAYGQALVTIIDPHITRTLLMSLQSLNERWKLFYREFFKHNLLSSFLIALLNVLVSPNGILYQELLISVLFNMGQSNVTVLHSSFVGVGYEHESKIIEEICLAKDFPTFSAKITQLVQDTKCSEFSQ